MEVFEEAQQKRLSSGFLMTPEDMLASPQLRARQFFQEIDHPSTGPAKYPGAPFRLSDAEWIQSRAPLLGEHTMEVLRDELGMSEREIADVGGAEVSR